MRSWSNICDQLRKNERVSVTGRSWSNICDLLRGLHFLTGRQSSFSIFPYITRTSLSS